MFSECKAFSKGLQGFERSSCDAPFLNLEAPSQREVYSCSLSDQFMQAFSSCDEIHSLDHCLLIALFFWIVSAVMIVGSDQCAKHITPSAQVNTVSGHTAKPPLLLCSLLLQRTDDNSKEKSILRRQIITGERESYFSWERDKGFGLRKVMTHWTSYGNHFRADSGGCGL
jgi:hypothetical protein